MRLARSRMSTIHEIVSIKSNAWDRPIATQLHHLLRELFIEFISSMWCEWVSFVGAKHATLRHFSLSVSLTGENTRIFRLAIIERSARAEREHSYELKCVSWHSRCHNSCRIFDGRTCHGDRFKHNNAWICWHACHTLSDESHYSI